MTDLRKAAEELMPILERWKMTYPPCSGADWDKVDALRQALAQQGKECIYPECEIAGGCDGPCGSAVEQEPVAWHEPGAYGNVTTHKDWALANGWEPLYTAPPKKEWVGLTDDELRAAYRKGRDSIPSPHSGWEWVDNHTPGLREVELTLYRKNNNGDVV